jgi:ubiquinone/menaquinone biosynthesis C-methylase UbiE
MHIEGIMPHRVCPWWLGYFLISPLRRIGQQPRNILLPYVDDGHTVLEPGAGMGFFTLELARLVGPSGRVIALDVQPKMLKALKRRARKAGLLDRIDARLVAPNSLGVRDLSRSVDFTLAFAVVHELPDASLFFHEAAMASKPGGLLLLAEPKGHVKETDFANELQAASQAGFELQSHPTIKRSYTAVFRKK